jgi:hypothetical protein
MNKPTYNQIFKAIELLTKMHIISIVEEANNYCYKSFSGKIGVIRKEFVNDIAKSFKK